MTGTTRKLQCLIVLVCLSVVLGFSNVALLQSQSLTTRKTTVTIRTSTKLSVPSLLRSLKITIPSVVPPVNSNLQSTTSRQEPSAAVSDETNDVDAMRAKAGLLRLSILKQQMELQTLERQVRCCEAPTSNTLLPDSPLDAATQIFQNSIATFQLSTKVLLRKVARVRAKIGSSNQQYENVGDYALSQTKTATRIISDLVLRHPDRLWQLVDPDLPKLVPHAPAILARLDKLESHVAPILERVVNNRSHLASVEPYLDEILERFDDIEPHLPWILDNIDVLAPYTGLLLKHVDELLLYAQVGDDEDIPTTGSQYDLAEQLLPYLEYYVKNLDIVGPHLPLLRPHVPQLLKYNRIGLISPHIEKLFAKGYRDLSASANMDVLLFWLGWTLTVPGLPALFFALPGSPRIVSFLANRLPKRFVRGYCNDVSCSVDNMDYGVSWNRLSKA
mmetsp:Transcript_60478/g.70737  ORF Transcript_60478/g.70737 Transcript_60478/m.70737 type:complete len:446 (+) Transcript_60478:142-1479(+)